jgi:hypothetical protein
MIFDENTTHNRVFSVVTQSYSVHFLDMQKVFHFTASSIKNRWLRPKYISQGLQSMTVVRGQTY